MYKEKAGEEIREKQTESDSASQMTVVYSEFILRHVGERARNKHKTLANGGEDR